MEIQHHQIIQKNEEKQKNEAKREEQETKHQVQLITPPPSSASSSPSHEFSFTISLHPPPLPPPQADVKNKANSPPPPCSTAIDLSPADEIFFHGHLLPLHLLSAGVGHPPAVLVSPRSSTNSLDSFTLPIKELPQKLDDDEDDRHVCKGSSHVLEGKERGKSKSFSLWMPRKSRKGCDDDDEGQKRKSSRFDLVKRLVLKPFRSLGRGNQELFLRQPPPTYSSYSGNLRVKNKKDFLRGRRSSAPVSMRNSPTNSGILVASGNVTPTNKSDSTMEELQAAIQAAIAHCKKSIDAAGEDRVKLQP